MVKSIIKLIRPKHWVKNIFVLMPIFFAGQVGNVDAMMQVLLGFVGFSLLASSVYVMNDIFDQEADSQHPLKKLRPIASGDISISSGWFLFGILVLLSFVLAYTINMTVIYLFLFYLVLNILYSMWLKRVAIVDVSIIAIGFVIRIFVGGFAASVVISSWIVIMTFLIALFLGLGKRRAEFVLAKQDGFKMRQALNGYTLAFINYAIIIVISAAMVAYLMYCFSPEVVSRLGGRPIYLSFIFVWLGMMRYLQLIIVFNSTMTPTQIVTKDISMIIIFLLWASSFVYFIYL